MTIIETVEGLASLATLAAREARRDPVLVLQTWRLDNRPMGPFEFEKVEYEIEERLALLVSTAKWVTRPGLV